MATGPQIRYDIVANAQGAQSVERLAGELEKLDDSVDPALAAKAKEVAAQLRALGEQQAAIDRFRQLKERSEEARAELERAQKAAQEFGRSLAGAEAPTRAQAGQLEKLRDAVRAAKIEQQSSVQALQAQRQALAAAGIDTQKLAGHQRDLTQQSTRLQTSARAIGDAYREQASAATSSAAAQVRAHREVGAGVDSLGRQLGLLRNLSIGAILGGETAQLLKSVGETADAYGNLSARVRLVTGDGEAFKAGMEGIFDVAKRTSSSLEATATLFTRIAEAGKLIGLSQKDALALTESINQAVQLSGSSADASQAAITQLIQGLQSGVLRGEEFNSVMEQAPRLAKALADGLGVTTGQLRELAQQGQLTSTTVIEALRGQAGALANEFGQLPATLGRAVQNLSTEWTKLVGTFDSTSGATAAVASGINALAANLEEVAGVATRMGAVLVAALAVQGVNALRAYIVQATAAAGATNLLAASISKIPAVINITIAAVGLEVGFQIGEMLHENSELARKLGVGIVAFFENVINDLRLLKEAGEALFTSDTIAAAFERYRVRGRELDAVFSDMWKDAEQAPQRVGSALDETAAATQKLGAQAQQTGTQIASAGSAASASVGGIGKGAATAEDAFASLAKAVGVALPAIGVGAAAQAKALADAAAKSRDVRDVLAREIPAAIEKLTGQELVKFVAAFEKSTQQAITAARKLAAELEAGGKGGQKELAEADRAAQQLSAALAEAGRQAAQKLGVDVVGASSKVSKEFSTASDNLAVLIKALPALQKTGVDTATVVSQALAGMINGAKNQAEIDAVIARVKALGAQFVITEEQAKGAMEQAADKAEELKKKLQEATPGVQGLGEAAEKAGVDFELLTTGISKGFGDNLKVLTDFNDQVVKAGVSAEKAGPHLAQMIDQRIAAANTKEELQKLAEVVRRIGADGKIAGDDVGKALDGIKRKAEELNPVLTRVREDAAKLGVNIKDGAAGGTKGLEELMRAYERLKGSGQATQDQLRDAFNTLANAAIKAADGIVPEWVKVEAELRGIVFETDEAGKAFARVAKAGEQAGTTIARGLKGASDALKTLGESLNEIEARNARVGTRPSGGATWDKQGFALNSAGERVAMEVSGAEADEWRRRFGWEGVTGTRVGSGEAFRVPPVVIPPFVVPSSTPTRTVNLNFNLSGSSYPVVANETVADQLVRALEQSKRAAGL